MIILTALIILVATGLAVGVLWRTRAMNPLMYFVVFSFYIGISTLYSLSALDESDIRHMWAINLYFASILIYLFTFYDRKRATDIEIGWRNTPLLPTQSDSLVLSFVVLAISSCAVLYYYLFAVGYNLFGLALSGGDGDFTSMRLAAYAGENYTGAGIINQIKNTILPIVFFSISATLYRQKGKWTALAFILMFAPFYIWAILGTGQRTFLVFNLVCLFIYMSGRGRVNWKYVTPCVAIVILLFSFYSVMLGRSSELSLSETLSQLGWRIFGSNQIASVYGFKYVDSLPTQYGAEWLEILRGFIPGQTGSNLSNIVHHILFRSMRGTAPVSLWVSVYYNFGYVGIPFTVFVIMKICEWLRSLITNIPKTELFIATSSFLLFYLAIIPISNPFQIINNGILGVLAVIAIFLPSCLRRVEAMSIPRFAG